MIERMLVVISCERDCERVLESVSGVRDVLLGNIDFALSEVRLSNSGIR